tara:strand:+ start:565 stop:876 length:312 start_codon:yes stop_codon:yes gene_type:complete
MDPIDNNANIKPSRAGGDARTGGVERAGRSGAASSSKPVVEADAVTITRMATDMLQLENQLADVPDANMERVEQLRAAISDGSYKVDLERIVNNLLQAEQDLS